MDTQDLAVFFTIVETGSFSKAETRLFVTRQSLMKRMSSLEQELGFALINRNSKGISLTEEGEIFYNGSKALKDQFDQLIMNCRRASATSGKGTLRILNPFHPVLVLENAFAEFSKQYSQYDLEVLVNTQGLTTQNFIDQIRSGIIDGAEVTLQSAKLPADLSYKKLADLRYCCILPVYHPFREKDIITPSDLNGQKISYRRTSNQELMNFLAKKAPEAIFMKTTGNESQRIQRACYANAIYISRAYFSANLENFVSVPLECDLTEQSVFIYRTKHSASVESFLKIIDKLYPLT